MSESQPDPSLAYAERLLRVVPLFRVLVRAAECELFAAIELPGPVLDVGTGDGTFPYALGLTGWIGIDPAAGPVAEATQLGAYRDMAVAAGNPLPFRDGVFASVISNSTLEHIPDVEPVIREMCRVLRPGGTFAVSFPSERFYDYYLGTTVASALRVSPLEKAYRGWVKRSARVFHADTPDRWRERFEGLGLEVVSWRYYFSHFNTAMMDLAHYLSVGSLLTHAALKRWVLWPGKVDVLPIARWLKPLTAAGSEDEGSFLFFHCRKEP